jgi:hypothetical protein
VQRDLIIFAQEKLICQSLPKGGTPLTSQQSLAILSVRLMLDVEPTRTSVGNIQADLVALHMRIAYSVPSHREYMRSGTPSEPILAEAAAQLMQYLTNIPSTLSGFVGQGLVEKGHAGELVARLLLTLAYDRAIENDSNSESQLPYSQGCSLSQFMRALFGETHYQILAASQPDNLPALSTEPFEDVFENSLVRFTHFGRADNEEIVTPRFAWAAFLRCMGVQCCVRQTSIDIIIPILLDKRQPVQPSNITCMFISVKDRLQTGNFTLLNFFASTLGFLPGGLPPRPYISVIMQLGINGRSLFAVSKPNANPERPHHPHDKHPRYSINAIGCDASLYPVIESSNHDYAALLQSRDLLREHARQAPPFKAAILEQKPFWNDNSCEHWIQNYLKIPCSGVEIPSSRRGRALSV